jgi:hypothetical protein
VEVGTIFRYARAADGTYLGYRIDGDGPIDIVWQPEWPGNIDMEWDDPFVGSWLRRMSSLGRVITHDHRGVGVSSRDVALPTLEQRVEDLQVVLRGAGARRPVLVGAISSGAVHVLLAATQPKLPRALIWFEPSARYASAPDYPWGLTDEERQLERDYNELWGTDAYARMFRDEQEVMENPLPPDQSAHLALQTRNACTPDVAARLTDMWNEIDVRGVLSSVTVPTLLMFHEGRPTSGDETRYIASQIATAEVAPMPGKAWSAEEGAAWVERIREFVGIPCAAPATETILATVLFTDIIGSTETQASVGDHAWKDLIARHHAVVREALARHGGSEIDTAGDGFYDVLRWSRARDPIRARADRGSPRARTPDPGRRPHRRVPGRRGQAGRARRIHRGACGRLREAVGGRRIADRQRSRRRVGACFRGGRRAGAQGRPRPLASVPRRAMTTRCGCGPRRRVGRTSSP